MGCDQKEASPDSVESRANHGDSDAQWRLAKTFSNAGNEEKAFEWVTKSAGHGNPEGQFLLGKMYWEGKGTPTNRDEAVWEIKKAANKGSAEAENWLGHAYLNGEGANRDYKAAERWLSKAAVHGWANAQFSLGLFYTHNHPGFKWDFKKAQKLITQAASQNYRPAQRWLASYVRNPKIGDADLVEAYKWAILGGDDKVRTELSRSLTSDQIETAKNRAMRFNSGWFSFLDPILDWNGIYWMLGVLFIVELAGVWWFCARKRRHSRPIAK